MNMNLDKLTSDKTNKGFSKSSLRIPDIEPIHLVREVKEKEPVHEVDKANCGLLFSWGNGKFWRAHLQSIEILENAYNYYICEECALKELELRNTES